MMGGGVCWLDYNNDGWMDLFAVNSYSEANVPRVAEARRLSEERPVREPEGQVREREPQVGRRSRGFAATAASPPTSTATATPTSTSRRRRRQAALEQRRRHVQPGRARRGRRLVRLACRRGRGGREWRRPARPLRRGLHRSRTLPIPNSVSGFPTNHVRACATCSSSTRATAPNGRAKFREVGIQAGLERSHFEHGLGAVFTDVNGDGRPDLYVANDEDPNRLYINVARPGRRPRRPRLPLRRAGQGRGRGRQERRHGRRSGRLQRRRAHRPVRDQFARAAACRLRERIRPGRTHGVPQAARPSSHRHWGGGTPSAGATRGSI